MVDSIQIKSFKQMYFWIYIPCIFNPNQINVTLCFVKKLMYLPHKNM
jgi:hypothetical protein